MVGETQLLRLFSGETCFKIVNILLKKADFTTNLSRDLNIESSRITHTLKKLEKNNLVETFRNKKLKYYQLKDKKKIKHLFETIGDLSNGRT